MISQGFAVPDRRTLIVLSCLIGGMTLVSGLLLALEPAPVMPLSKPLAAVQQPVDRQQQLFQTTPAPLAERYSMIVVYHSGWDAGSARRIALSHRRLGLKSLGHHFVVGNGQGSPDGQIEVGVRWQHQLAGADQFGEYEQRGLERAIGVCLVGDTDNAAPTKKQMRELLWLVHRLQERYDITGSNVQLAPGVGPLFPVASFRQQLLRP